MFVCYATMYVCVACTCSDCGGQKREPDPLDLELQTVGSHHVGSGNPTVGS